MELSTPTAASGQKLIATTRGQDGFIVLVKKDSGASLRILTGQSFAVDGIVTADTTGLVIPPDSSIELPPGAYVCKTATDATAADFHAVAFVRDRKV